MFMKTSEGFFTNSNPSRDGGNQRVSTVPVLIPDDTDCCNLIAADVLLCGRERASLTHTGNKRFRQMIVMKREAYQKAFSENDRLGVIEEVVMMVRDGGGRFLRRNTKSGELIEMEDGLSKDLIQKAFQYVLKPIPDIPERTQAIITRQVSEESPPEDESRFQTILSSQRKIFDTLMRKQGVNVP